VFLACEVDLGAAVSLGEPRLRLAHPSGCGDETSHLTDRQDRTPSVAHSARRSPSDAPSRAHRPNIFERSSAFFLAFFYG
jgi:hypothetical protein